MKQPGWRPHQQGAGPNDWTAQDWAVFSAAQQFFTQRRRPRNRGKKRIEWWGDRQAGRDPRRRRVDTQNEGRAPEDQLEQDATMPESPSASGGHAPIQVLPPIPEEADVPPPIPEEADVPPPIPLWADGDQVPAVLPPLPPPPFVPTVRPWAATAAPKQMAIAKMVPAKAMPKSPFVGPHRPWIAHPRPISQWGDSPGFLFQFETQVRRVWVPKAVAQQVIEGFSEEESLARMNLVMPNPNPPKAYQVFRRPPVYMIEDESDEETIINTPHIHYGPWDDEAPGAGGSSSSSSRDPGAGGSSSSSSRDPVNR